VGTKSDTGTRNVYSLKLYSMVGWFGCLFKFRSVKKIRK